MNIGIFSKLGANGGSEMRCAEMCNSIVRYTNHSAILLCERDLHDLVRKKLDPKVEVVLDVFKNGGKNIQCIYDVDSLLIVNSDSYSFSKADYFHGKTEHHDKVCDLKRIKQMVFLYNFVISPAANLYTIQQECEDVRIVCGNRDFYRQMNEKSKFDKVCHLPRIILDSPIALGSITTEKTASDKIRIGKHSKAFGYKFNPNHRELIEEVNEKYGDQVIFDFMGVPKDRAEEIQGFDNVTIRKEFSSTVRDYLMGIDIFLFFISWDRNEPWSRAVAEGLTAGCPVLATNRAGNKDQVIHRNNGFLCDTTEDFFKWIAYLIQHKEKIKQLGSNGALYSKQFTSEKVIEKYMDFIGAESR